MIAIMILLFIAGFVGYLGLKNYLKKKVIEVTKGTDYHALQLIFGEADDRVYVYVDENGTHINLVCENEGHSETIKSLCLKGLTPEKYLKAPAGRKILAQLREDTYISRCKRWGFCIIVYPRKHWYRSFEINYAFYRLK